jgi:hypothetical protein
MVVTGIRSWVVCIPAVALGSGCQVNIPNFWWYGVFSGIDMEQDL